MRLFVGIDDTDGDRRSRGTGHVARRVASAVRDDVGWLLGIGVVRQQLRRDPCLRFTHHNRAACLVFQCRETPGDDQLAELRELVAGVVRRRSSPDAAPALCLGLRSQISPAFLDFGLSALTRVVSVEEAHKVARSCGITVVELGELNDGVVGAVAAVALTAGGDAGRFTQYGGKLRRLPPRVRVRSLTELGIRVATLTTDGIPAQPDELVVSEGRIRPRLIGGRAVVLVVREGQNWCCHGEDHGRASRRHHSRAPSHSGHAGRPTPPTGDHGSHGMSQDEGRRAR